MKKWLFFGLLALGAFSMKGQLQDDFSDGNLSEDPSWLGQTGVFTVENGELRLLDANPLPNNISYLYLPAPVSADSLTVWEWYVRLDFAPSSSNLAYIYLLASNPDLTAGQFGYYLRIGGISGADDALELFRQDGNTSELLISGTPGALGAQPAVARIRVERSVAGLWSMYADYTGGSDLQAQGSASDLTYLDGQFVGLVCVYTSTRNDDFYFDDVYVNPLYTDQDPPILLEAIALDSNLLVLTFDEPLEESSAKETGNYFVSDGIGEPSSANWDAGAPEQVLLQLAQPLQSLFVYTLEVQGIADLAGNESTLQTAEFTWIKVEVANRFDVLFNEIMADPSPPIALPEFEFLEIYNRSAKPLQLEGWTLSDGGTPAVFPSYLLQPGQYLLLCDEAGEAPLAPYGEVLALEGFPGLNNGGDLLLLEDANGQRIDQVAYSLDWYGESDKDDGGWSLELINPLSPCEAGGNWRASENLLGGTPGTVNSIWAPVQDEEGPIPLLIYPDSPNTGVVTFSEALDLGEAGLALNFHISPGIAVSAALPDVVDPRKVRLEWAPPLGSGAAYTLSFSSGLSDCAGNPIDTTLRLTFGLPEPIEAGDLIVNEILYQPLSGGEEFIEIYNRSGKVLNVGDLILGNIQGSSDSIAPVADDRLLYPGEYLVFCEFPSDLLGKYPSARDPWIQQNDLPTLPDGGGNVTLYVEAQPGQALIIDEVDYSPDMHHVLLHETRGVSLERIDPETDGGLAANWHSAAQQVGYATPTAANSQYFELESGGGFFLPYKTFSPDGDGEDDFLLLQYELEEEGWTASIRIFDAFGRLVREIAQNQLLGSSGAYRWDGDDLNGGKARMGIYVIWVQQVHPDGRVEEQKWSCVLAGKI
ncbi:MAG: lamin tail domain-containing protein [Saprospirales bacterium]|nr:lamin tail domain-containing protein [Saprospirales bacterium]